MPRTPTCRRARRPPAPPSPRATPRPSAMPAALRDHLRRCYRAGGLQSVKTHRRPPRSRADHGQCRRPAARSRKVTDHCTQTYERNHGPAPKHANFIENVGDASTADVLAVMAAGRRRVPRALRRDARARKVQRSATCACPGPKARRGTVGPRARLRKRPMDRSLAGGPGIGSPARPPTRTRTRARGGDGQPSRPPTRRASSPRRQTPSIARSRASRRCSARSGGGRRWLVGTVGGDGAGASRRSSCRPATPLLAGGWLRCLVACSRASRTRDRRARRSMRAPSTPR